MKALLSGIVLLGVVAAGTPAWSQAVNAPGSGGTSKPGVEGLPGNKSGPAANPALPTGSDQSGVRPQGRVEGIPADKSNPTPSPSLRFGSDTSGLRSPGRAETLPNKTFEPTTRSSSPAGSDESGVPAAPGNKSGPAVKEPNR
jgi:hypothetical protein